MTFYQAGSIKYYQFHSLEKPGIYHAVFTRHGGVSPDPWKSLNFGASVGDDPERVKINRETALATIGIYPEQVYDVYQVHSTEIVVTDRPLGKNEPHIKADGIITHKKSVTLMMRFADCVPILLFDPVKHIIGITHAGWAGTVQKIAAQVVKKMVQNYGTLPDDIIAAIGPSIGPDHYAVRNDVVEQVKMSFREKTDQLIFSKNGKTYFNLWEANRDVLNAVGVNLVEISGICTQCNLADWYSHRGEHGKTGRFGAIIGIS